MALRRRGNLGGRGAVSGRIGLCHLGVVVDIVVSMEMYRGIERVGVSRAICVSEGDDDGLSISFVVLNSRQNKSHRRRTDTARPKKF